MPSLTCASCKVSFDNSEAHRLHYKSEWHKYNLKRKIAEFPTVTFEEFQKRASAFQQPIAPPNSEITLTCKLCHKNFNSENALVSHLKSKKHLEITGKEPSLAVELAKNIKNQAINEVRQREQVNEAKGDSPELFHSESDDEVDVEDDDDDWESLDEMEDEDIPLVPTNICFFCNSVSSDIEANVHHMKSSHSFFIPDAEYLINREGLLCYLGQKVCYGFTCLACNIQKRSARSVQQHMIDKGHCRMQFEGNAAMEYEDFFDYSTSYPDHSEDADEEANVNVVESDGYQLTLPSGSTIGHRSLALYYRQNLKPVRTVATKSARLMHKFRAICQGSTGFVPFYKISAYKYSMQRQKRNFVKLGVKQNKLQPHFRSQIMF